MRKSRVLSETARLNTTHGPSPSGSTDSIPEDSQYSPQKPQENVIFWGTPFTQTTSIVEKTRTFFWFIPDYLVSFIHRLRPFSYLALYVGVLLLSTKTLSYASQNPDSLLGAPPTQALVEGTVGTISTLNPLFVSNNQLDRDLQVLIFDKLIGIGIDGNPKPEIASSWAISEDGLEYTFFLRKGVYWHDGKALSADDVIFTFETIQNMNGDDSYSDEFKDITLAKIDKYTVLVSLSELNPTLMSSLSFPILPKHILDGISTSAMKYAPFNNYPIGTGPFKLVSNTKESIILERNERYFDEVPHLKSIEYRFFASEDEALIALKQFQIHTLNKVSEETITALQDYSAYTIIKFDTPLRQKLIYFNMRDEGPLSSAEVRHALSAATDRESLVSYIPSAGSAVYGTIPTTSWAYTETSDHYGLDLDRAKSLLESDGWTMANQEATLSNTRSKNGSPLTLVLTYLDTSTNTLIAETLQSQWLSVGVNLLLDPQSYERISSETVPRRNFDMLLFEVEYTSDPDRYNLWHSSKVDYPGLNLSGYSSKRVDLIIERARKTLDKAKRKSDYAIVDRTLMNDMPALFLFNSTFTFIANTHIEGIELENATLPQQRYNNVQDWYVTRTRLGWRNWQTR